MYNDCRSREMTLICIVVCFFFLFTGCKKTVHDSAFVSKLDVIDVYITQMQYKDAINQLKKLEKDALSGYQRLGIIKRYFQLGENTNAEKFLEKSLKKLPNNEELLAVYVNYLLENNRIEEATPYANKLKNTQYSSLYAQLILELTKDVKEFYNEDYVDLYLSVANVTKDSSWLRNAATLIAVNGNIQNAINNRPKILTKNDMPDFWALLSYDGQNYVQAIEDASLLPNNNLCQTIISDSFIMLEELDNGAKYWNSLINSVEKNTGNTTVDFSDEIIIPPPEVYKNAA